MRTEAGGWTYILASQRNGTLYTGSARNLVGRIHQHREGVMCSFTSKYRVTMLVWFEAHESVAVAYKREQQVKRWRREWKLALIEKLNPRWEDLYPSIAGSGPAVERVVQSKMTPTLPGQAPDLIRGASRDLEPTKH
jgi:putative endonuclease